MILSLAVVRALFSLMRVARLMLERLVVPLKVIRVRAIRFLGTKDYWFLGTIELGRSENDIKSLGGRVTRSFGH